MRIAAVDPGWTGAGFASLVLSPSYAHAELEHSEAWTPLRSLTGSSKHQQRVEKAQDYACWLEGALNAAPLNLLVIENFNFLRSRAGAFACGMAFAVPIVVARSLSVPVAIIDAKAVRQGLGLAGNASKEQCFAEAYDRLGKPPIEIADNEHRMDAVSIVVAALGLPEVAVLKRAMTAKVGL